jgi:hypothetical protein
MKGCHPHVYIILAGIRCRVMALMYIYSWLGLDVGLLPSCLGDKPTPTTTEGDKLTTKHNQNYLLAGDKPISQPNQNLRQIHLYPSLVRII